MIHYLAHARTERQVVDSVARMLRDDSRPMISAAPTIDRDTASYRAGLIVPPTLAYLRDRCDFAFDSPNRDRVLALATKHVRRELRGVVGVIGLLFLRAVIAQVVAWLVEWYFTQPGQFLRANRKAVV